MATEEVTFALELEGGLARTAQTDAEALEELKTAITADVAALREMQTAYRNLKGSATANVETVKQLKDRIAASKATLAGNTEKLVGMKGAFEKLPKPAEATRSALDRMFNGTKQGDGPLASLVERLGGMKSILGSGIIATGLVAVAAGMVAVAAASVAATVALVGYAIAAANARRSDMLRLEGLSKHRNYWLEMVTGQRRAADSSGALQSMLDRVSASSPLLRSRIGELQGELYKAGLRSGTLQSALEALAIVESTQGTEAAQAFKARALSAQLYGTSIKKLSDDVKTRLGGIAKAQMLSLDVQTQKLKENMSMLFSDVKIEPFLQALSDTAALFSQSTASGRALKTIVDSLISPMISSLASAGPLVKRFFQGFIIAALLTAITVLKVRNALRDTFGGSEFLKNLSLAENAVYVGAAAFGALAGVVIGLGVAFGILVGAAAAVTYGMYKMAEPFIWVQKKGLELAAWIFSTDWLELGSSIVAGIANGIRSGAGAVVEAMTSLGGSAMKAFKQKLGIASPSKVAFAASLEVPRGARMALDAGRPMVRASAERLGAATEAGMRSGMGGSSGTPGDSTAVRAAPAAAAPAAARNAPAARPITITFGDLHVHGGGTPEGVKRGVREALEEMLQGAAIHVGAA